jgi:hypothetical protein
MKYIFVTGAPGSKWSSVVKNIYSSLEIDHSDSSAERSYAHSSAYSGTPMHEGAYFDPGMEFGNFFDQLSDYSKEECEAEFDRPFLGTGVRIIKSHLFAYHIDFLKKNWPTVPLVLVHRSTDACLGWWIRCGGFDITYPNYKPYYKNLSKIGIEIDQQNNAIVRARDNYTSKQVINNYQLATTLNLSLIQGQLHDYVSSDISVTII